MHWSAEFSEFLFKKINLFKKHESFFLKSPQVVAFWIEDALKALNFRILFSLAGSKKRIEEDDIVGLEVLRFILIYIYIDR